MDNKYSVRITLWHHVLPGRSVDIDVSLHDRTYYGTLDNSPIGISAFLRFNSEKEAFNFVDELGRSGWDVASTEYEYLKLKVFLSMYEVK